MLHAQLGTYVWALSITSLFSIGIDLGLSSLLTREAARDQEHAVIRYRSVLGLKLVLAILTLVALAILFAVHAVDRITFITVAFAAIVMVGDSFTMTNYAFLRARQNVSFESVGMLGFHLVVVTIGVLLFQLAHSPVFAAVALAAGSVTNFLWSTFVVQFKFHVSPLPAFRNKDALYLLKLVPAFAIGGIFIRIYSNADTTLLGYLAGQHSVGLYSVPAKVLSALQVLIPGGFMAAIYPAMSYQYHAARQDLSRTFERTIGYLLLFALPITAGLTVLIPHLLATVWPAYREATNTFLVMSIGLPFLFLTFPSGYLLLATDRQRANTINRGIIMTLNVVANIILIPILGTLGAGISFLGANVILLALDLVVARAIVPHLNRWFWFTLIKGIIASSAMAVVVIGIRNILPLPLTIMVGSVVYIAFLIILRTVSRDELLTLRDLFHPAQLPPDVPTAAL